MVENRLERILEDKAYVFTSCFAPMNCSAFGPGVDNSPSSSDRDTVQAKQNDALLKMGVDVKRHVAKFVAPRENSLMREDDDDEDDDEDDDDQALLSELEAHVHDLNFTGNKHMTSRDGPSTTIEFEIADSGSISELHTVGQQTWEDIEYNTSGTSEAVNSGRVLGKNINATNNRNQVVLHHLHGNHITEMYKQSVRSKFEFYRKHQSFVPSPKTTEGNENSTSCDENVQTGIPSNFHDEATDRATIQRKTVARLKIDPNDIALVPLVTSPQSRRSEITRKMIQRRQAIPLHGKPESILLNP